MVACAFLPARLASPSYTRPMDVVPASPEAAARERWSRLTHPLCWAGLGVLVAVALYAYLPALGNPVDMFDEGMFLAGAQRLTLGDHLYRDILAQYGPWPFWLAALGFQAGGESVLAWRTITLVSDLLLVILAYLAIGRVAPWPWALLGALTLVVYRTSTWGLVLPLAAVLAATSPLLPRRGRWLIAGVLLGLGAGFKPEAAAWAGLALVLALATESWWALDPRATPRRLANAAWLAGGSLLGALPLLALLLATGALPSFLQDLLVTAPRQVEAVALPWPDPFTIAGDGLPFDLWFQPAAQFGELLASALLTVAIPIILASGAIPGPRGKGRQTLVVLALWGLLLLPSALVRADYPHIVFALVPLRILGWMAAWLVIRQAIHDRRLGLASAIVGLLALATLLPTFVRTLDNLPQLDGLSRPAQVLQPVGLDRYPVFEGDTNLVLYRALAAEGARLPTSARVLVLPGEAVLQSFSLGRAAPGRYDWVLEGVLTPESSAEYLATLQAAPPAAVLLLHRGDLADPALEARLAFQGLGDTWTWVRQAYVPASTGRDYTLLVPR